MCVTNNVHHRNNPHHENLQSCLFYRRSFCFRYNNGKSRISRTAVHEVKKFNSQLINHFHMLPNTAIHDTLYKTFITIRDFLYKFHRISYIFWFFKLLRLDWDYTLRDFVYSLIAHFRRTILQVSFKKIEFCLFNVVNMFQNYSWIKQTSTNFPLH